MNDKLVTVKVQDGCSQLCSYCLVRKLRGKSISLSYSEIISDIVLFSSIKNSNKICICGIDTLEYYNESVGNLIDLLKKLVLEFPNMIFELDNINPFNETMILDLLELMKITPNLAKKLCISIQSASDNLLNKMHRPYKLENLKKIFQYGKDNNLMLTTEIIVGFPGETEEDIDITYNFLKEFGCDFIAHSFSPRPETEAINLPNQIPESIIIERMNRYKKLKESFYGN